MYLLDLEFIGQLIDLSNVLTNNDHMRVLWRYVPAHSGYEEAGRYTNWSSTMSINGAPVEGAACSQCIIRNITIHSYVNVIVRYRRDYSNLYCVYSTGCPDKLDNFLRFISVTQLYYNQTGE